MTDEKMGEIVYLLDISTPLELILAFLKQIVVSLHLHGLRRRPLTLEVTLSVTIEMNFPGYRKVRTSNTIKFSGRKRENLLLASKPRYDQLSLR